MRWNKKETIFCNGDPEKKNRVLLFLPLSYTDTYMEQGYFSKNRDKL